MSLLFHYNPVQLNSFSIWCQIVDFNITLLFIGSIWEKNSPLLLNLVKYTQKNPFPINFCLIPDKGKMEICVNKNLLVLILPVYSSNHFHVYKHKKVNENFKEISLLGYI